MKIEADPENKLIIRLNKYCTTMDLLILKANYKIPKMRELPREIMKEKDTEMNIQACKN